MEDHCDGNCNKDWKGEHNTIQFIIQRCVLSNFIIIHDLQNKDYDAYHCQQKSSKDPWIESRHYCAKHLYLLQKILNELLPIDWCCNISLYLFWSGLIKSLLDDS